MTVIASAYSAGCVVSLSVKFNECGFDHGIGLHQNGHAVMSVHIQCKFVMINVNNIIHESAK